jgi:hypothetical protein
MEGQTTQWPSERETDNTSHQKKEKKTKIMVYKTINRKRKSEQHDHPLNNWGEPKWS